MNKPRRQNGASRQLGAINEILKGVRPDTQHPGRSESRASNVRQGHDQQSTGRAHIDNCSQHQEGSRQPVRNTPRTAHMTRHHELQAHMARDERPRQLQQSPNASRSSRRQIEQHRLWSPQRDHQNHSYGSQKKSQAPFKRGSQLSRALETTEGSAIATSLGSEKRKRPVDMNGDDNEHDRPSKKHQQACADAPRPNQPLRHTLASQGDNAVKVKAISTTSIVKSQDQSAREPHAQLPSPPSSNATPEHGIHAKEGKNANGRPRKETVISTPAGSCQVGQRLPCSNIITVPRNDNQSPGAAQYRLKNGSNTHSEASSAAPTTTTTSGDSQTQSQQATLPSPPTSNATPSNKKRQRYETEDTEHLSKLLQQPRAACQSPITEMIEKPAAITDGHRSTTPKAAISTRKERKPQPMPSFHHPEAQAVRPEGSFAPVAPNPECNFKLLAYDHDSVPVLYSTLVKHSNSTELLNCPPEELVFDALDAIEKGFGPYQQYGWPSATSPLGRKPSKDNPTKVINDVDLYLHESDGKLYVATDRGLIIVAQYLRLIGVPDIQPIRFEGRIPPWAKVALEARETRRVVHSFGLAKKSEDPEAAKKVAEDMDDGDKDEVQESRVLKLKLGSSVIVYKIDQNDEWAYGRSRDSDKKGWLPISYTCPLDWSLDRFSGSNAGLLDIPLPMSKDNDDRDWNGLLSWYRQKGYPEPPPQPTAAKTTILTVATSSVAKTASRACMMLETDSSTALGSSVNNTNSASAECLKSPSATSGMPMLTATDKPAEQLTTTGKFSAEILGVEGNISEAKVSGQTVVTEPPTSTRTSTAIEDIQGDLSQDKVLEDKKKPEDSDIDVIVSKVTTLPADEVSKAPAYTVTQPRVAEENGVQADVGTITTMTALEGTEEVIGQQAAIVVEDDLNIAESTAMPAHHNSSTAPRSDPFERNDDIEFDWGESDDE